MAVSLLTPLIVQPEEAPVDDFCEALAEEKKCPATTASEMVQK
jgi:hypothetical protein